MNADRLIIKNFRNIKEAVLEPCRGINIIYGENAQGKTNLLEAIWLFSGFKSFRGSKDRDLIKFGEDFFNLDLDFYGSGREKKARIITSAGQKKILLNSVPVTALSKLVGKFNCVVFSPSYLSVVKGNPGDRRRFADTALCQIKPKYAKVLIDYNKIIMKRNSFLKNLKNKREDEEFLEIWDIKLAKKAAFIINQRLKYLNFLKESIYGIYSGLSGERESLEIFYNLRISPNKYKVLSEEIEEEELLSLIRNFRTSDILTGNTNIGAHRDDIGININGISAKSYGSQGQQRSAALALKLGEAEIIKNFTDEKPVILLDDVMSELDVNRQNYILNHIKDWQVFITCCEPSTVLRLFEGKTFNIKDGRIVN